MDTIPSETQSQYQRKKIRNILMRYCGSNNDESDRFTNKNYQHPENAYLAKYFPKYYKSLALKMKRHHPLLSKIKRIKKLKRFTGNFNDQTPKVNWFKILANFRKEVEELPQINLSQPQRFSWKKAVFSAVKFFFQVTKLQLPTFPCYELRPEIFLTIWKAFSWHLGTMKNLKVLEIDENESKSNFLKPLFEKLNEMPELLGQLKVLKSPLRSDASNEILLHENFLSHLTHLNPFSIFSENSPICQGIPQICKNLKSFSMRLEGAPKQYFPAGLPRYSQYLDPLTQMQELPQLQSISITWSSDFSCDVWPFFVPPPSLRNLELKFSDLEPSAFKEFISQRNLLGHWRQIKKLDLLALYFACEDGTGMAFTKNFITTMLQKILSISSFSCSINLQYNNVWRYEPFDVEKVPHLYGNLKKIKAVISLGKESSSVGFDFKDLKPFRELKEIDFLGSPCSLTNVGEAIFLLENNTRKGDLAKLKLGTITVTYPEELGDLLKKIAKAKKGGTNLKIELAFKFEMEACKHGEIKYFDQFCEIIQAKSVKGLEILFDVWSSGFDTHNFENEKRVLERCPGMRNLVLKIHCGRCQLEFIKRDGEKEQMLLYHF